MAVYPNLPQGVTTITPPARELLTKVAQVVRTDTTRFDAFVLPKDAVVAGVYVLGATASDAVTTATITVGTGASGTELINGFSVKTNGAGYFTVGTAGGSSIGTQLTADTLFKAVYAETGTASTTGGPWLVKVEYYIPGSGSPGF